MDFDLRALMDTFAAESDELLDSMEQGLLAIEENRADPDTLNRIFRDAHTLKGGAASLDFAALAGCAHATEDVLETVRDGRAPMSADRLGLLLTAVDTLRALTANALAGRDEPLRAHADVVERLRRDAIGLPAEPGSTPEGGVAAASGEAVARAGGGGAKRLRVGLDRLDRMVEVVGELGVSRDRLRQIIEDAGPLPPAIQEAHRDADRLYAELHELTLKMRMVPIGPVFRQQARTVRGIGTAQGKMVRLETAGDDLEIDNEVIELLREPLLHMIRNAVDHGIEPPAVRASSGKPPFGTISLSASNVPGGLEITVADDGAGLDLDQILTRARTRGLIAPSDRPSDAELHSSIFESGLSTSESVSDVSGRGVGMDIVKRSIDALRGTIGIDSIRGQGCTMTVRVPLTLAVIRGFCVGSAGTTYVIPVDMVAECIEWPAGAPRDPQPLGVLSHRGRAVPFIRLNRYFGGSGASSERESAVIVRHGALEAAVTVDSLYGERQTVVKPLGPTLAATHGVSGSTILGDGSVALLLNVPQLLQGAGATGRA